jgi:uncharacterized protein (TIGR01777 family)
MKILVSGASGLVGQATMPALRGSGHDVRPLVRDDSEEAIWWNPENGLINDSALKHWRPDAFVHLAGENIASHRWDSEQKRRIRDSRVAATEKLVGNLLSSQCAPPIFIGASAIGYYGNRGGELLTENSPPGNDFLAEVCRDWENAALPLARNGTRVVHLRFGMILSRRGGALARMLPIFRLGLGGRLGNGKQWVSWVALTDVVRTVEWALTMASARGAYNAVSPSPVTNAEFTRSLGPALHRPTLLPAPATGLRLAFGEMADALLLTSQRAIPERLCAEGFQFQMAKLPAALKN